MRIGRVVKLNYPKNNIISVNHVNLAKNSLRQVALLNVEIGMMIKLNTPMTANNENIAI